jgi:hypothetical protein
MKTENLDKKNDERKVSVVEDVTEKISGLSLEELTGGSAAGLCCIANSSCNKNADEKED